MGRRGSQKDASATEQEALKLHIIDFVAEDIPTLLKRVHGRQIVLPTGPAMLATEHATVRDSDGVCSKPER